MAVHEPADPQETLFRTVVTEFCAAAGKETSCVCPQTPSTDEIRIAYVLLGEYTFPTAVQLPADVHDTESSPEPSSGVWAVDHTPPLDDTA